MALDIFQEISGGDQNLAKKLRPPTLKVSSLSQFLSRKRTCHEWFVFKFGHKDEPARNIILGVATLIATATYQAALGPPGGYWGDNSSNTPANSTVVAVNSSGIAVEKPRQDGNIILNGSNLYQFTVLNSLVFLASIITVWITAIPLLPHTIPVHLLTYLVGAAYFVTLGIEFPKSDQLAGACIMGFCLTLLVVVLVVPTILWLKYYRLRRGLDATGRRGGNFLESKDRK